MSELRFESLTMPAVTLGPENPLPHFLVRQDAHDQVAVDPAVPEEIRRHIGYGRVDGCLPYGLQDNYDRTRRPAGQRNAFFWAVSNFAMPFSPSCSNAVSCSLVNGASSPVPCTSTNWPVSVITTFMSTAAATSSV